MPLSLAEIKQRAIVFSKDWATASRERAESQTFWNEFFHVFGLKRRTLAAFEEPVKNLKGDAEFIDLFWPGKLIAEHKTRGRDLDKAHSQALNYVTSLASNNRADESPRYIIVSDFAHIALHDLEDDSNSLTFPLADFHKHIRRFAFIAGYETRKLDPEDPANERAVEKLANLHDQLELARFTGHALERFLVRVLFCLFAEDTDLFEPEAFKLFLLNNTRPDGSDLGPQLSRLFQILDKPLDQRPPNLPEDLAAFPYVNGQLFAETLEFPEFSSRQREALLDCARFQWAKISPAIFGSLFQAAMQPRERRQIGAHYTSERDIMKLIRSLFLDDLRAEFESSKSSKKQLAAFHDKLASLKFLDPACGCGNFLVITYRELRLLELDVLKTLHPKLDALLNIGNLVRVNVDQMYGIEIDEWPARIAEVALWLLDHQMNQLASQVFGNHYARLPLQAAPTIIVANALRADWNSVLPRSECAFILGNPPFVGKKEQNVDQKFDMKLVWDNLKGKGTLDYVTCWYRKAAEYTAETTVSIAFVSTNSITQGEQVGVLWGHMFRKFNVTIQFAHRTFPWTSEARGRAHVHVVIIGFGKPRELKKRIYDYTTDSQNATVTIAHNISPYLIEGSNIAVNNRNQPLCKCMEMTKGSEVTDNGHLLLDDQERKNAINQFPELKPYILPFSGGREFINNLKRWCLWLVDAPPQLLRINRFLQARLEEVRLFRLSSPKGRTVALAKTPAVFGENRQPSIRYLLIPKVSSEKRYYIPMGFLPPTTIVSGSALVIPGATRFEFGILSSTMHMAWMRQVCGRMKSDYQYSAEIVYNNFPWPAPTAAQRTRIEQKAQAVLDARQSFLNAGSTLADLYDPLTMPSALAKAHADLDLAVDRAYRPQPFPSDRHRFEFLFALYEQLTAPLTTPLKKRPK